MNFAETLAAKAKENNHKTIQGVVSGAKLANVTPLVRPSTEWMQRTVEDVIDKGYRAIPVFASGKTKPYSRGQSYPYGQNIEDWSGAVAIGIALDDAVLLDYDGNHIKDGKNKKGEPDGILSQVELGTLIGDDKILSRVAQTNGDGDSVHFMYRIEDGTNLKNSADGFIKHVDLKRGNQLMHLKEHKTLTLPAKKDLKAAPEMLVKTLRRPENKEREFTEVEPSDHNVAEAVRALKCLDASAVGWKEPMMAFKVAMTDAGAEPEVILNAALDWSSSWVEYNEESVTARFESFSVDAGGIGASTLFWLARAEGFKHRVEADGTIAERLGSMMGIGDGWDEEYPWLVNDFIPAKSVGFVAAPPAGCKTFFAIDLMLSVAHSDKGCKPLGILDIAEDMHGAVVYGAVEGRQGLSKRFAAWHRHHDIPMSASNDRLWQISKPVQFDQQTFEDTVEMVKTNEELTGHKCQMIVFDTFRQFSGVGDENNSSDVQKAISWMYRLRDAVDCVVLAIHHSGKGSANSKLQPGSDFNALLRGSSDFGGSAEFVIGVMKHDTDDNVEIPWVWSAKLKDAKQLEPLPCQLNEVTLQMKNGSVETHVVISANDDQEVVPKSSEGKGSTSGGVVGGVVEKPLTNSQTGVMEAFTNMTKDSDRRQVSRAELRAKILSEYPTIKISEFDRIITKLEKSHYLLWFKDEAKKGKKTRKQTISRGPREWSGANVTGGTNVVVKQVTNTVKQSSKTVGQYPKVIEAMVGTVTPMTMQERVEKIARANLAIKQGKQ